VFEFVRSAGVLLYLLLSGELPFPDESSIHHVRYSFEKKGWSKISEEAKNLLRCLLCSAGVRYNVQQALMHPWLEMAVTNTNNSISAKNLHCLHVSFVFASRIPFQHYENENQMNHIIQSQILFILILFPHFLVLHCFFHLQVDED
jgi:serine/threonine protein kinase